MRKSRRELAQSVGLWLAEGDRRTRREITFTNNQPYLIKFFHRVIRNNLNPSYYPRVAVYLPHAGDPFDRPVIQATYRTYVDIRATRPYFIYRISGVKIVRRWKKLVTEVCTDTRNFQPILQGFFAGEGNIKYGHARRSRTLRISQGKRHELLEKMLRHFGISFSYGGHRSYSICGRDNLEKLLLLEVSCMHRIKHWAFLKMMRTYRQRHYRKHVLPQLVLARLVAPLTSRELAIQLSRSTSRISHILSELQSAGRVRSYRVNSTCYWSRSDRRTIVISNQKDAILRLLHVPHRAFELARIQSRTERSVSCRLRELESLGLVVRRKDNWYRLPTSSMVVVK